MRIYFNFSENALCDVYLLCLSCSQIWRKATDSWVCIYLSVKGHSFALFNSKFSFAFSSLHPFFSAFHSIISTFVIYFSIPYFLFLFFHSYILSFVFFCFPPKCFLLNSCISFLNYLLLNSSQSSYPSILHSCYLNLSLHPSHPNVSTLSGNSRTSGVINERGAHSQHTQV